MKSMSLGGKVRLSLMVLGVIITSLSGYLVYSQWKSKETVVQLHTGPFSAVDSISEANILTLRTNLSLLRHVNDATDEARKVNEEAINTSLKALTDTLATLKTSESVDPTIRQQLEKSEGTLASAVSIIEKTIALSRLDQDVEARQHLVELRPLFDSLRSTFRQGIEKSEENFGAAVQKQVEKFETQRITVLGIIALTLAICFSLFRYVQSSIRTLEQVLESVRSSAQQVSGAAEQIADASNQMASTSSEQAAAVEETSASLEEISGMVDNNARHAETSARLVEGVRDSVHRGAEVTKRLTASMQEILESNRRIEQLVRVIEEIGEKTAIIDEIVFQTKLLSFNASVEAERAGEHGRGFAVVAQEVGNLAQMSGKAALEISSIVKTSIKEAQEVCTENRSKVELGNRAVAETSQILEGVRKDSEAVHEGSSQILAASREQTTGVKQVSLAVENISKATQDAAASSEQAAAAAEELRGQAGSLNQLVLSLSGVVYGASSEASQGSSDAAPTPRPAAVSRKPSSSLKTKRKETTIVLSEPYEPESTPRTNGTHDAWHQV